MRYKCTGGCKDTWFGYTAKADIEIVVNEKGELIDLAAYNDEQSKAAICKRCAKDATQLFEKCRDCGCWKEQLVEGLCLSCYHKRLA